MQHSSKQLGCWVFHSHRRPCYCLGNLWGFIDTIQRAFIAVHPTSMKLYWTSWKPSVCLSACVSVCFKLWLLFLMIPACNFATVFVWLCVWALNAIITKARSLCYLPHIEPRDSYHSPFRATCLQMKIQCRRMLWPSCVPCTHLAAHAWLSVMLQHIWSILGGSTLQMFCCQRLSNVKIIDL